MPIDKETSYSTPFIFQNSHVETIIPNLFRFTMGVKYERERIDTLDGDFLDLDWSRVGSDRLIIFSHGLESNSRAAYVVGMVKYFNKRNWDALAWNFRSCSGEVNRTIGFYHPGQTDDFHRVVTHALASGRYREVALIGFSLGGAYTLRYLGEMAGKIPSEVVKAVAFSTPVDLGASASHLSAGAAAWYGKAFLFKYKRKMAQKDKLMPGVYDMNKWNEITTLPDFDREFNAPWYGFRSAAEFHEAISSKPLLPRIDVPTLIVNAANDPFLPPECYPEHESRVNRNIHLDIPDSGGHIGFMTFSWKGIYWSETRAEAFLNGK